MKQNQNVEARFSRARRHAAGGGCIGHTRIGRLLVEALLHLSKCSFTSACLQDKKQPGRAIVSWATAIWSMVIEDCATMTLPLLSLASSSAAQSPSVPSTHCAAHGVTTWYIAEASFFWVTAPLIGSARLKVSTPYSPRTRYLDKAFVAES